MFYYIPTNLKVSEYTHSHAFHQYGLDWVSLQSCGALGHNSVWLWCHHIHWYHPRP